MADWSKFRNEPIASEPTITVEDNAPPSSDRWAQFKSQPVESPQEENESIFAIPSKDSLYNKLFGPKPNPESEEVKSPVTHRLRSALQIPAGAAKIATWTADVAKKIAEGLALEGMEDAENASIERGIPFDREKYMKAVEEATAPILTQDVIEKWFEKETGLPLEPKTAKQKGTRLTSEVFGFMKPINEIKGASFYPKQPSPPPASLNIASEIIGPNAPSQFVSGEEALQSIKGPISPPPPLPPSAPPGTTDQSALFRQIGQRQRPSPITEGRQITPQQSRQLGIQRSSHPKNPTVEDKVLGTFKHESYNPTITGKSTRENFIQRSDLERKNVNKLYTEAEELNASFAEERSDIVHSYLDKIAEIDSIAAPSTVQKTMRREMQRIVKNYAEFDKEGNIINYRPVSNQDVLNQAKALRSRVDSDFMHGNAGNEFIPVIEDLTNSARSAAVEANAPEAVAALDNANAAFRQWNDVYNNDLVAKIRNPSNNTPNKTFKSLSDIDNLNIAKPILKQTPEGKALLESYQRKIADQYLKKYYENPKVNKRELNETLRELEAVLDAEQITAIRDSFNAPQSPRFPGNVSKIQRAKSPEESLNRVQSSQRVEQLNKLMNERSGIQEVRDTVPEEVFNRMRQSKTKEIMFKGKHEAEPTAAEIRDILNTIKNRELMIEMHGEEVVDELYNTAKSIAAEEEAALAAKEAKALSKKETKEKWRKRLKTGKQALGVANYLGLI